MWINICSTNFNVVIWPQEEQKLITACRFDLFMKVIVTGGAGFVGSHLVRLLISKNHFPLIVDNLSSGNYKYIKKFVDAKKARFLKIDIRDFNKLSKLPKADAVIHLAAVASVVESITNPIYVNNVNVDGTLNMLEFCRKKGIKKFVFTSSAAIYGNYEKLIDESSPTIPTTVYGSTKLTGEQYCRIYSELFGVQTVILRPFNIYGPLQNDSYAGVISKFMTRINNGKQPIIYGDGRQTRDFVHVEDVAKAFESALLYKTKTFDLFNVATGKSTSINHLWSIFSHLNKAANVKPIYKKAIPGVVVHSSANIRKIKRGLHFSPSISLENGIAQMLEANVPISSA